LRPADVFLTAVQGLSERRFRLALNVLGVLIGCAAITGLVSITQGLSVEVSSQLDMFGPKNIMVVPFQLEQGRGLVGERFNWREVQLLENIPHVKYFSPGVANQLASYTVRGKTRACSIIGVSPHYFKVFSNFKVEEGRALVQSDSASAVVGHLVAFDEDGNRLLEVGDRVTLRYYVGGEERTSNFRVVGILEKVGGSFGSNDDLSFIIPFRMAQGLLETEGQADFMALQADEIENVDSVAEEVEELFGDRVLVMTFEQIQEQVGEVLGTIEAVLAGIAAISLIVAGVSIINTMTISVLERTREIGILKAIGSTNGDILLVFLTEATITGLLGGLLGSALGFAAGLLLGNRIGLPVSTEPRLGLMVTLFALVTSVVAGVYPSWQAASLDPVEALRYE